jgi:hypothetical protein
LVEDELERERARRKENKDSKDEYSSSSDFELYRQKSKRLGQGLTDRDNEIWGKEIG